MHITFNKSAMKLLDQSIASNSKRPIFGYVEVKKNPAHSLTATKKLCLHPH